MPDREQTRRDAESALDGKSGTYGYVLRAELAEMCLSLLAELEQAERETRTERGLREDAERERDKAQDRWSVEKARVEQAERDC